MRLDELEWQPREVIRYFDIASVRRPDGKYVIVERRPDRTDYFCFWVQPVPYRKTVHPSVTGRDFIWVDNILMAQVLLIELLGGVSDATG